MIDSEGVMNPADCAEKWWMADIDDDKPIPKNEGPSGWNWKKQA